MIFKGVVLCVVCAYAFVLFVSPFLNVEAQGVTSGLMKISGSDDVYLWYAFDGKKYKRLIHRNAISLYSWLNGTTVETVNQNEFDSYTTVEVATHYPQGRGAVDEQGLQVPPELWRIRNDNGILTVKRLYMSVPSAIISGYEHFNIFEIKEQEIELYNQGDPIYYTGTTSWESNVYRKQDALQEDERGTRIYDTIIPQGENRCTIQGDVVAVVGKPGVNYVTITQDVSYASLGELQGGNVTVYIQASDLDNQTPSFTLECQQESPLNVHTIDTTQLPDPKITFTSPTYTGEQTFEMILPAGYHYCETQDSNGNAFNPFDENLDIIKYENGSRWVFNELLFVGGKTYNISVEADPNLPIYQGTWTIQCHAPQTITLTPNVLTRVTGVGYPTWFTLDWTTGTEAITCRPGNAKGEGAYIRGFNNETNGWYMSSQIFNGVFAGIDPKYNTPFLSIEFYHFSNEGTIPNPSIEWIVFCKSSDSIPQKIENETNFTPFITGPKTECPPNAPNNPNLLCRVVERSDEIGRARGMQCANHLLGVDDIIGSTLLVPEDLCIQYSTIRHQSAGGTYSSSTVRILWPLTLITENAFDKRRVRMQTVLIHELCHAQQDYYAKKQPWAFVTEFADKIEYQWELNDEYDYGYWYSYPNTEQYYGMYGAGYRGFKPNELGAEFCTAFAVAKANKVDLFLDRSQRIIISKQMPQDEMLDRVLNNPDANDWITNYMLNPNLKPLSLIDPIATIPSPSIQITDITVGLAHGWLPVASFTVHVDQSAVPLSTDLIEQGWQQTPIGHEIYIAATPNNTNELPLKYDGGDTRFSNRIERVIIDNKSERFRQWSNVGGYKKYEIVVTPATGNSNKQGAYLRWRQLTTRQEIDLYQLLIDRGLLNEDGSLPDE